jgi:hypothetical protein
MSMVVTGGVRLDRGYQRSRPQQMIASESSECILQKNGPASGGAEM